MHGPRVTPSGIVLVVLSALSGCYSPKIRQGGLRCGTDGACPTGFSCDAYDGKCYSADAGPVCDAQPPQALCATPAGHDAGGSCDPICQTGCACGWCDVTGGTPTCNANPQGTKTVGDACNTASAVSGCQPGLICRAECQTLASNFGRCYKLCTQQSDCADLGTTCSALSQGASFSYCAFADPKCDPVALTGCPTDGNVLACYATSTGTTCDCRGDLARGSSCLFANSCVPGLRCLAAGSSAATCVETCKPSQSCSSGACNSVPNDDYGYCM
jgi:hypothetical protein